MIISCVQMKHIVSFFLKDTIIMYHQTGSWAFFKVLAILLHKAELSKKSSFEEIFYIPPPNPPKRKRKQDWKKK